jgi:dTDP-4-dehydrorhamnose 3,5-epimerase
MHFSETSIPGVFLIDSDIFRDERGSFVRVWTHDEFTAHGLETGIALGGLSTNHRRGTIRGLHLQTPPVEQAKAVRAARGAVFDVAVDLRVDSPTYCRWVGVELSADNHRMLYLPKGVAHGYQTLTDDAAVLYFVSAPYSPAHERGVRWNDPAIGVEWPLGPPTVINARDAGYADLPAAGVAGGAGQGQPA